MSNTTTYDVKLRYLVDGKSAARETSGLIQSAKELERTTSGVTNALTSMGAVAAGAFGVDKLTKAFIGFNASAQDARISLSAMIEGSFGGTWDAANAKANKMYDEFQKFSTTAPVTTAEIMDFGRGVFMASSQAGASIQETTNITEQGVIAAKAFGSDTKDAAYAISEMLQGNARKTNSTVQVFMGLMKTHTDEFNKLDPGKRLAMVEQVLNSPAMKDAATAFGSSWSGVLSTFEDKLQILGGQVGLPLFKALTKEIASWSDWLTKNTYQVEQFASTFAEGLVDGFKMVKSAIGFLVDHADTLILIGKTWAAIKIGEVVGGLAGRGTNGIAGLVSSAVNYAKYEPDDLAKWNAKYKGGAVADLLGQGVQKPGTISGIGGVAGALPAAGQALAAGYAIGTAINEATGASKDLAMGLELVHPRLDETSKRFYELEASQKAYTEELARAKIANASGWMGNAYSQNLTALTHKYADDINSADDLVRAVNKHGIASDEAKEALARFQERGVNKNDLLFERANVNRLRGLQGEVTTIAGNELAMGIQTLNETQIKNLDVAGAQEATLRYIASTVGLDRSNPLIAGMDKIMMASILWQNGAGKPGAMAAKPTVNVHIDHIEIQSEDPDRTGFGLVQFFRDSVKNPSAAAQALREG
jgi:hypothetical protein